jgi:hypothetical protein
MMFGLLKFVTDKIDFLKLAETLRKKNNRETAAPLHIVLVTSYDIIEIYQIILDEMAAALDSHRTGNGEFYINPARFESLLTKQADNLSVMETLLQDLVREASILNRDFVSTYREIVPHKFGIISLGNSLLMSGRLPLSLEGPNIFPAERDGSYRTLWFTWDPPPADRSEINKYLHGDWGDEKVVVDLSTHDGEAFFRELERYLRRAKGPRELLAHLRSETDKLRDALLANFTLEDILTDIGKVSRRDNWAAQRL